MIDFRSLKQTAETEPNLIALIHKESYMNYRELWDRSEAVGWFLCEKYDTDSPVAIIGDKENDMVSAIFGAIKAAKTYVVIPSYYPEERLKFILKDSNADVIINLSQLSLEINIPKIDDKGLERLVNCYAEYDKVEKDKNPDDTALLMYTSGSTGVPKGVELSYRNFVAKYDQVRKAYGESCKREHHIEMNLASYAFSASYGFPFFLDEGKASYICVPKEIISDYRLLFDDLKKNKGTGFFSTPALLWQLLSIDDFCQDGIPSLHTIWVGGDVFTIELYKVLRKRFPDTRIMNGYGMTECLANGMFHFVTDEDLKIHEGFIAVGDVGQGPYFLMDEAGKEITCDGQTGEIIMFGDCVGKGYHNMPEQTAEKFFKLEDGTPAFKTGDLAVIHHGQIFFLGRKDFQVKIGGNRIELPEVESNIRQTTIVKDCAVTVKKEPEAALVAFVVLNGDGLKMKQMAAFLQIKKEMKQNVESYMIPGKIVFVDELPKNINAKIDRALLTQWAQK